MSFQGSPRVLCSNCSKLINEQVTPQHTPRIESSKEDQHNKTNIKDNAVAGGLLNLLGTKTTQNKLGINDMIDPKVDEEPKINQETNKIFDLLSSTNKKLPLDKVNTIAPLTTKDTARTNATGADDDYFIESASQVSGPRPIEPFESLTTRDNKEKLELPPSTGEKGGSDIIAWLMNKQQADVSKPATLKKTPSEVGSNVSNKTLRSSMERRRKMTESSDNVQLKWLNTSGSDKALNTKPTSSK